MHGRNIAPLAISQSCKVRSDLLTLGCPPAPPRFNVGSCPTCWEQSCGAAYLPPFRMETILHHLKSDLPCARGSSTLSLGGAGGTICMDMFVNKINPLEREALRWCSFSSFHRKSDPCGPEIVTRFESCRMPVSTWLPHCEASARRPRRDPRRRGSRRNHVASPLRGIRPPPTAGSTQAGFTAQSRGFPTARHPPAAHGGIHAGGVHGAITYLPHCEAFLGRGAFLFVVGAVLDSRPSRLERSSTSCPRLLKTCRR